MIFFFALLLSKGYLRKKVVWRFLVCFLIGIEFCFVCGAVFYAST